MRKVLISLIIISSLVLIPANCASKQQKVTAFVNVNLVPMTDEEVIADQTVLVEGSRIVRIGPSEEVIIPENAIVIDGTGAFLMPGLADMHMHISNTWLTSDWPICPLKLYLANGITTIRDFETCGTDDLFALRLRDEIDAGIRDGPTIYTCGVILGGHRSLSDVFGTEDAHEIIRELKSRGYDFIKIYSYLSGDKFKDLVTTAKQEDMYTAGHIPFAVGLEAFLSAGMDEIAHLEELNWELFNFDRSVSLNPQEWDLYILFETFVKQAKAVNFNFVRFASQRREVLSKTMEKLQVTNIPACTNLIVSKLGIEKLLNPEVYLARPENMYLPKSYLNAFKQGKTRDQQRAEMIGRENTFIDEDTNLLVFKLDMDTMWLWQLKQAGIPLLLATDGGAGIMGIVPGFSIHWELQIMVENGFTPYEAIATGTINAARVIEKMTGKGDFGAIEVGNRADMILLDRNPLEDISNIKDPLGVMAAGKWYSKEALELMTTIAQESDP